MAVEPVRERRMVAREQQEQPVADRVEGERATLPDAHDVGVEDRAPDVVQLEVALEPGGRRQVGRVERLDLGQVPPLGVQLRRGPPRARRRRARRRGRAGRGRCRGSGCRGRAGGSAPRRGRRTCRRAVRGRAAWRGARQVGRQRSGRSRKAPGDDGRDAAVGPVTWAGSRVGVRRSRRSVAWPASRGGRLGQRVARGSDDRVDVVGGDVVMGRRPAPDRAHIPPSATFRARSASRKAARSRSTLKRTKFVATRPGVEAAAAVAGRCRPRSRCRPCPPGPRPGAGRWRGRRRVDRSSRPGHRPGRRDRPRPGRRPGACRRRPACGRDAPAR